MKKKVIFVGLSGGVDSAVSAALLQSEGHEVVGVFIKTWHPDFLKCNEEEERRDAMRVAAFLDIPFLTLDLEEVYKKEVGEYMISEYRKGRTPNPDVMCNKEVKFGAFLKKALAMGADYVATGHYAAKENTFREATGGGVPFRAKARNGAKELRRNVFSMIKGVDPAKDQSYFLWTLNQEQLSKTIFPVGNLKKTEVRKLALKFGLPVAEKKDSQGICFLGPVDLKEFLKHYIKEKKGKVIDEKGEVIGTHDGVTFHTLRERHGFTIIKKSPNDKPYYIIGKDIKKNILIVSHSVSSLEGNLCLKVEKTNWISEIPKENEMYTAQIRYHGEFLPCKVKITGKSKAEIIFSNPVLAASGQSCVVYNKDVCLGGGVIE